MEWRAESVFILKDNEDKTNLKRALRNSALFFFRTQVTTQTYILTTVKEVQYHE